MIALATALIILGIGWAICSWLDRVRDRWAR